MIKKLVNLIRTRRTEYKSKVPDGNIKKKTKHGNILEFGHEFENQIVASIFFHGDNKEIYHLNDVGK